MPTELAITGDETVPFTLQATDDVGNAIADGLAGISGITWSEDSSGTLVTLAPADPPTSCQITAVGPAGTATVTVTGTLADGTILTDTAVVTIGVGAAAELVIVAGEVVHK